ncbi:MAG: hypothetical protein RL684_2002 [Pseudomonadota bacterium]
MSAAQAVFLSYASQDAEPARRIAESLRAGGIEVWFDQSELRGGDAWDASIRRQIKGCSLFLAVISASTQARVEGYFRREWNLAVGRTLDMADEMAFLLPVVIDQTTDVDARVPEKFREVQWTRLPGGETPAKFVAHVHALIHGAGAAAAPSQAPAPRLRAAATRVAEPARFRRPLLLAIPALLLLAGGGVLLQRWQAREHARTVLLPDLQERVSKMFRSSRPVFDLAVETERRLPGDPALANLWPLVATTLSVETEPAGAQVYWKDYNAPADEWRAAGTTPLKGVKVARDYLRLEVRKAGYQTIELAAPSHFSSVPPIVLQLKLDPVGSLPGNMVRVPKSTTDMDIVGLGAYGQRDVPEFLVDRYEVTNRQFKAFIDAGGYTNASLWRHPILDGGKVVPLQAALAGFRDKTGRPGPSTWEAGSFPDGQAEHPVTGVSWYEAAAYAAWVHKQLPTVFHWAVIADTGRSEFLLPVSNFSARATTPVGSLGGLSTYGVYDIAGNAREWTASPAGDAASTTDQHFILGGGWSDPSYSYNDSFTQAALNRDDSNGFRCIKTLADEATEAALARPLAMAFRDYTKERPVGDAAFAGMLRQFAYDRTPVDAKLEQEVETEAWRDQVVTIDAGYNKERLRLHVFLPKHATGALQPVVFFSGSNGIHESTFNPALVNNRLLFVLKSGRALVFPIYKGTYERQDDLKSDLQETSVLYKDHVIMWVKEYSRIIDYLETRKDMQADKVAYLGVSWGGFMGGIIPAVEKRIKAVVLNVGGMEMERALPEVDQINYLPRVTQPVLMLNGSFDMYFPVESSQKPMFRLLGAPEGRKKMVVYPSGHLVPQTEFIRETLAWFDTYLGPIQ